GLRPRAPARPARRSACPSAPRRAQAPCARPFLLLAVLRPRPPGSPLFPYTTLFRSLLAHHRGVEEVLADKAAERGPELVLLPPDERGVRDRDPQRMPEQRRHGEPVRDPADHARLRGGAHVPHPRARAVVQRDLGEHIDDAGDDEESGRDQLHAAEGRPPLRVRVRVTSAQRRATGRGDRVEGQCASSRLYLRKPTAQMASPARKTTMVPTTEATTSPRPTSMSSM